MTIPTLRFRFQSNTPRLRARVLPAIPPLQPQFRNNGTHIQWRVGTNDWADLVALTELEGPVASIVPGDGIDVDVTDPVNPTISVEANLAEWNGVTPSTNGKSLVAAADYAAMRALLDLEIGTDVQAYSADLVDLASRWAPASAAGPASLDLLEDADNGTNKVTIIAPAALANDRTFTLPDASGTAALQESTVRVIRTQVFTSSGTYTPHANMLYCKIEAWGAGGGGGGVGGAAGYGISGGGGGQGAYSCSIKSAADIGASQTVTVGTGGAGGSSANGSAGGTTSVGTLVTAAGGSGGSTTGGGGAGGATSGTGDIKLMGMHGENGTYGSNTDIVWSGGGGGPGGATAVSANATSRSNGTAGVTGGGGSGGVANNQGGGSTGGAGGDGWVRITEYCSA